MWPSIFRQRVERISGRIQNVETPQKYVADPTLPARAKQGTEAATRISGSGQRRSRRQLGHEHALAGRSARSVPCDVRAPGRLKRLLGFSRVPGKPSKGQPTRCRCFFLVFFFFLFFFFSCVCVCCCWFFLGGEAFIVVAFFVLFFLGGKRLFLL